MGTPSLARCWSVLVCVGGKSLHQVSTSQAVETRLAQTLLKTMPYDQKTSPLPVCFIRGVCSTAPLLLLGLAAESVDCNIGFSVGERSGWARGEAAAEGWAPLASGDAPVAAPGVGGHAGRQV